MEQLKSQIPVGISSMIISLFFLYAVIVVLRSKKRKLEDIWYLLFWFFGFFFWFFTSLSLFFWESNFSLSNLFVILSMCWIAFHAVAGPFYVLTKITKNKIIHFVLGLASAGGSIYYLFFWLPRVHPVRGLPYVYYNVGNIPKGYFLAAIILVSLVAATYVLIKGFKTGEMSLEDLSSFYAFYALVIYAAISLPAVLYIRSIPILQVFYVLIPYLVYLGYGKNKKKNN